MGFIRVDDGTRISVTERGSGPPVVLLAGWGLSHRTWAEPARWIERAGHRTICVDLRGHGDSEAPVGGDYGIARHAHDVASVLDALALRDPTLIGWSLGGMVALRVVAARSDLPRLILVGSCGVATGARPEFPFGRSARTLEEALVSGEREDRGSRRAVIAGGFGRPPEDDLLDRLTADAATLPTHAGVACLQALFGTVQLELLAELRERPLSIITGTEDRICPVAGAEWVCAQVDDGLLRTIPGVGHYPMFESPEAFTSALSPLLARS